MKFIPLLILLLLKDYPSFAQNRSFGVIASAGGGNISYPIGENAPAEFKNPLQPSFQVGIFLENKFTKHSSVFISGSYLSQRAKWILKFNEENDTLQSNLSYLVLSQCYLYHLDKFRLLGGLQIGWLLCKYRVENGKSQQGAADIYYHSEYTDFDIQNFDVGVTAGIQYQISP